ncbi:MAG: hypothetical protein HC792_01180 [Acaryochloridaceae cyanobacterium CSU_5_19]|nr:hypothetical protein [Acaryochloridaceae cyanobacterium CSU_5_19]
MLKLFRAQTQPLSRWLTLAFQDQGSAASFISRPKGNHRYSLIMAAIAVATLTSVVGHRFYNEPQLAIGRPAPETIRAPRSTQAIDQVATDAAIEAALKDALSIYRVDQTASQIIIANLEQTLLSITQLRQRAGPLPFIPTTILSVSTQTTLRQMDASDWQRLLRDLATQPPDSKPLRTSRGSASQTFAELRRQQETPQALPWPELISRIEKAQQQYQAALRTKPSNLIDFDLPALLALTDQDWQQAQNSFKQILARILTQGIPPGLPNQVTEATVAIHLQNDSAAIQQLGERLLPPILQPNLRIDPVKTLRQREIIAQQIPPVTVSIRRDDIIVTAGTPISQRAFALLEHFQLSRRGINGWGLAFTFALVSGEIALFIWVQKRLRLYLSKRDYLLILLLSTTAPLLVWTTSLRFTSLPAIGLLISSFYSSVLGAVVIFRANSTHGLRDEWESD